MAIRTEADDADLLAEAERVGRMGSWVVEPDRRLVWSANLYRLFGLEPGTPPGPEAFYALVHPEDRERVAGWQRLLWAAHGPRTFGDQEYRIVRPGGEIRWFRGAGSVTRDAMGLPVRLLGTITDVTDEVLTRRALLDAHRMLQEAERITRLGSFVWDASTGEAVFSTEFLRILGLPPDAGPLVRQGWFDHLHPDDRDAQARWFAGVVRGDPSPPLRARVVGSDGRIVHAEVRAVVQQDGSSGSTRVFGSLHDITERVALERTLQDAARIEAIGSVSAGVAHDLNNYLTVLQGTLEALHARSGHVDPEAWRAGQRAMEQCTSLTRNLLTYARHQPVAQVDVDLAAVAHDAAALLRRLVGPSIEVVVEVPASPPRARADRGHVENVLLNLGVNARDAMPAGGRLILRADQPPPDEVRRHLPPEADGSDWVRLVVVDTGVGIPPEHLPRIFEPFFTTKRTGGTGLGLPSVQGIVRGHGGHVTVRSEVGRGAAFSIWLPAAREGRPQESPSDARVVLVVDDVPEVRELAARFVRRGGWRAVEASSVDEALAMLAGGGIDVVLTDVVMPERTGFDLLRAIRASPSPVPVVLMTGYSHDAQQEPDVPVVRKPFRQADLLATLELALRRTVGS